jgi:succinate-semialdehyde dehydrogenase / glutarate-semialdehyde dehydrogenase
MTIASTNPATGERLQEFAPLNSTAILAGIENGAKAFQEYRSTDYAHRARWLQAAARILRDPKQSQSLARLATIEMGKPITQALAELEKCAVVCEYYAANGAELLATEIVETDALKSGIAYQPMGLILAVMPWNFPFWQVFRCAAPALMAGNGILLKHASNVPQCAIAIAELWQQAGVPEGLFQTLLVGSAAIPQIINHPAVKAAALTGSEAAGASLAQLAGAALKKTVLELGGSDPAIVTTHADLPAAAATIAKSRLQNSGQSCIAAKRAIVLEAVIAEFTREIVPLFQHRLMGDPSDPDTEIGPLATAEICEHLAQQVQTSIVAGANCLVGGCRRNSPGHFYAPTILYNLPQNAPTYYEEFFGPVLLLFVVPDLPAAIALANDTPFGLGASAWTTDPNEQQQLIAELQAGAVFINGMVKSDPRLPFGGIDRSGYGRELGREGIREFTNIKTFWIG